MCVRERQRQRGRKEERENACTYITTILIAVLLTAKILKHAIFP
jgi:hypothetical protein